MLNPAETTEQEFSTGENFAQLLEESALEEKHEGTVTRGVVIAVDKEAAIVDIGFKTEGRIPLKEFRVKGEIKAPELGEEVDVFLERMENQDGEAVLSREKAIREESWEVFEKASEKGENVDGVIFGRVKGGFTVDLGGLVAFLPGSQVDVRPVKDVGPLMNITQPFQILKMDRKRGNIVVSRRAILEESRSAERDEMLSTVEEGKVLEGVVKNITNYGAFVDLGAIDGLLHVTDISWQRISHPSEVLTVGDTIKVQVIKYDQETKRISLGMKQLEDSPWSNVEERYPVGFKTKGQITNITDYGAFVELERGVEGLVHVSEMSWTKKNVHPSKIVSTSQEVDVIVLEVEPAKHRISLGIKQCQDNPWSAFAANHSEGEVLEGKVKNTAEFGVFVELDGEVDGLVHVSDVSWENNAEEVIGQFSKDQEVKVKILSIDVEKERVSLGIKQLSDDPLGDALKGFKKGSVATFTVSAVQEDGIEVQVDDNIKSFIRKSELSADRVEQRPNRFAVGDRVDAKITAVDKASRKISLSIKAYEAEQRKKAIAEYGSADSGATLGDILGVALDESAKESKSEEKEEAPKKAAKKDAKKADE